MKSYKEKQTKQEKKGMKTFLKAHGLKKKDVDNLFGLDDDDEETREVVVERMKNLCKSFPKAA